MAGTSKTSKRAPQTTIIKVGANEAGKLPPQAQELEDSVIGALMIEKEAYGTVADLLRPEVFYKDQNRMVFEAIRELAAKDQPIDVMTVGEKLKSQGTLEKAGGLVYLADLSRRVASAAHLRYHAQIIAQKATARDLIAMAARIEEKGFDETQDVEELMQVLSSVLNERERMIVVQSFGIGCPERGLEDIGSEIGLTRERVRQIRMRSIEKVRNSNKSRLLLKHLG